MAFLKKKSSNVSKLIELALTNDAQKLQGLLAKGSAPSLIREDGLTPLHAACQNNAIECVEALLNAGADASKLYRGRSSLQIASASGFIQIVHLILRTEKNRLLIDICEGEPDGRTALHLACIEGHVDLVEALLGYTANPEKRDRSGQTALIIALEYHQIACAKILVESGKCNLNTMNAHQMTPLHVATRIGNAEMVAILLKKGVNVFLVDDQGRTALDIAQELGHESITQMVSRQRQIVAIQQERSMTNAMVLLERISPAKPSATKEDGSTSPTHSQTNASHVSNTCDSGSEVCDDDTASNVSASQLPAVVAELKAKLAEVTGSHDAELQELKSYVNLLEKNNKVMERSLSAANSKLVRSGQEVSAIDMYKIDRLNAEITQLTSERDELLAEKERAALLEQELSLLRSKLVDDGRQVSDNVTELRLTRELETAQKESAAAKAQVLAMKKQLQDSIIIETELRSTQTSLAQSSKKISTLESDLGDAKDELVSLRTQLADSSHKLKQLISADYPAKIKLLESQLEQQRTQNQATSAQLAQSRERIAQMSAEARNVSANRPSPTIAEEEEDEEELDDEDEDEELTLDSILKYSPDEKRTMANLMKSSPSSMQSQPQQTVTAKPVSPPQTRSPPSQSAPTKQASSPQLQTRRSSMAMAAPPVVVRARTSTVSLKRGSSSTNL